MKIIAFGHRKSMGKDTCANFLSIYLRLNNRGINVKKIGFASKLKDMCHQLYGWAGLKDEEYYEIHPKEKDIILPKLEKSPRQIWIDFGTLAARAVYSDTWIDYLFNGIKCNYLLLKDLRFVNEFEAVKANNGLCIRVDNDRIPYTPDLADTPLRNMPDSEWTIIIKNNGTLNELNDKIIELAKGVMNDSRIKSKF